MGTWLYRGLVRLYAWIAPRGRHAGWVESRRRIDLESR